MPRSRSMLVSALVALCASGVAMVRAQDRGERRAPAPRASANAPPAAAASANRARMEWLLKKWQEQSAKLKTLDVGIYRIDRLPAWKEEIHYEGRAIFQSPELAFLDFKKIKTAPDAKGKKAPVIDPKTNKMVTTPHERIICNGQEVWQYLYDVRQIFIYPLDKEQRKRALDEGPLPFLFNMRAEDAKRRYAMSLEGETEKYYLVAIQPRLQEDRESFKLAYVFLEKKYLLPVQIRLFSPDGKSTKDFRISGHRANQPVDGQIFQGTPVRGWKVVRNPDAQGRPRGGVAAPDRQPALRPSGPEPLPRR